MIKLYGQKVGMLIAYTPMQRQAYKNWFDKLREGALVVVTYKMHRPEKSYRQVKNHWGNAIQKILQHFEDNGWDSSILLNLPIPTGVPVSKALLQEYLYAVCPMCNDEGERITLSKADTSQASKFFEDIRAFAASQWSVNIPDPDPDWKRK